ncbi:LCP family protein [Mesobacillus foraminis]|uniref:LCP family protein n=1 Tax=Mesobacillus foraminis TaxID=279826 RepID=UPI001BE8A3CC|nr:LCP family protein [Mesobacillus foraminis]MBT2755742.1 LCP family protein [Mesobacillus foraminis]
MNRQKRHKRKSRVLKLASVMLAVCVAAIGYFVNQYQAGVSTAESVEHAEFKFNGEKSIDNKVNVLLLGVDARSDEEKSRTDSIMVAQYDPKEGGAKVISIMRDIYTEIPGYKNYKINTAFYLGGPELLRETFKNNFDLDIEYYALIDFTGFEKMVDALAPDGIEIGVEKKMSANIGVSLRPGLQRLNGKELLGYARFRKDAEADFGRVRRQQQVINALKDELLSVNGLAKMPKLIGTAQPYIQTNLQAAELLTVMKSVAIHRPEKIETLTVPIQNSYTDVRYEGVGLALDIDFEKNKEAIHSFLDGDSANYERRPLSVSEENG